MLTTEDGPPDDCSARPTAAALRAGCQAAGHEGRDERTLADSGTRPAPAQRLYRTWSQGGYGLLVTGNVMVDRTQFQRADNVVIEDDRDLDATHSRCGPSLLTMTAYRSGSSSITRGASPTRWRGPHSGGQSRADESSGSPTPRELTILADREVIERFVTAAAVCETAGIRRRSGPRCTRVPGHTVSLPADQPA
jgi:2,4-dienoyl-CoA reductase-like NADH-dependent reductase (Old Yellow Enzyme family)